MSSMHILQVLFTPFIYQEEAFCREENFEIITLSMKITFLFYNFYCALPSRNTATSPSCSWVLQLCLPAEEACQPGVCSRRAFLSCFVLLNLEVLANIYMHIINLDVVHK